VHRILQNQSNAPRLILLSAVAAIAVGAVAGYMGGRASARQVTIREGAGATVYSDQVVSDRRKKANFRREDPNQVLERVARLPIESWNYRSQSPSVRHIGPTAQDFYAAFRVGESDTTITATDMAGVSLLAIQALQRRVENLEAQLRSTQPMAAQSEAAGPARADVNRRR
jgi:trimeric autotransporter adhesin